MKNLTEFPGFLLRRASAVRREKLQELLAAAKAQGGDKADVEAPAAQEASAESASDAGDTSAETGETPEVAAAADESKSDEASADASDEAKAEASDKSEDASVALASDKPASDADLVDEEALAAAVGETMKIADERLVYLMGALKAVGRKGIDKVRQVRVFKGEEAPSGAFSIDDLHFVVDRLATPAKKSSPGGQDRGGKGRGNKGRDDKGRGGGGGGGGGGKPGGGGFSSSQGGRGFDSMARDERPGDVPSGGLGWSLERAPGSDKDKRGGKGKPRRKGGPRRGKPGDKPGGGRKPRGNKPMPEVIVKAPTVAPSDK